MNVLAIYIYEHSELKGDLLSKKQGFGINSYFSSIFKFFRGNKNMR